jgi:hypothetical protein
MPWPKSKHNRRWRRWLVRRVACDYCGTEPHSHIATGGIDVCCDRCWNTEGYGSNNWGIRQEYELRQAKKRLSELLRGMILVAKQV